MEPPLGSLENHFEIFVYDGTETRRITDNGVFTTRPMASGGTIVWAQHRAPWGEAVMEAGLFLFDGESTIEIPGGGIDEMGNGNGFPDRWGFVHVGPHIAWTRNLYGGPLVLATRTAEGPSCPLCTAGINPTGTEKLKLKKAGNPLRRQRTLGLSISSNGTWTATDEAMGSLSGTWTAKNKKGTKADLELDPGSEATFEGFLSTSASELAGEVVATTITSHSITARVKKNGDIKLKVKVKFDADRGGVLTTKNKYSATLKGQ